MNCKRILQVEIECGDTTCASAPGKFCNNLMFLKYGSIPICGAFIDPATRTHQELQEDKGWIARCSQCLVATIQERPRPVRKVRKERG